MYATIIIILILLLTFDLVWSALREGELRRQNRALEDRIEEMEGDRKLLEKVLDEKMYRLIDNRKN